MAIWQKDILFILAEEIANGVPMSSIIRNMKREAVAAQEPVIKITQKDLHNIALYLQFHADIYLLFYLISWLHISTVIKLQEK